MTSKVEGEFIELEVTERRIIMYLPIEYKLDAERIFPVVFLHDGDFLFRESIDVIEQNVRAGVTEPVVFVGIESEKRNDEYTPWEQEALFGNWSFSGKGDVYLESIYQTIVPYVQKHFRISSEARNMALGGVSLGGLISLYAMYRTENIFKNFILISASLWFKDFIPFMKDSLLADDLNIYMYVGEREGMKKSNAQKCMVPNNKIAYHILQEASSDPNKSIKFETDPLGTHEDSFFLQYFPNSIKFLFPALKD